MYSDAIADMLARIKNGYGARLSEVELPWSKAKEKLAEVLKTQGYISDFTMREEDKKKYLKLKLSDKKRSGPFEFRRVSKPSLRRYVSKNDLPTVLGGLGIAVISTPLGLMTNKEARRKGVGGEVWCEVW